MSGLYPCLRRFEDSFYGPHRANPQGAFYSDAVIFSPEVPFPAQKK